MAADNVPHQPDGGRIGRIGGPTNSAEELIETASQVWTSLNATINLHLCSGVDEALILVVLTKTLAERPVDGAPQPARGRLARRLCASIIDMAACA